MSSEANPAWPRITLLTPCLNAERYIGEVVATVERQQYPNLEHIVVDGGSLDTTLDILGRHSAIIVASERDKGSHDAMNKGLRLATGDIIGFINSDDLYGPGALANIAQAFAADPSLDVAVLGTVLFARGPGSEIRLVEAHGHFTEQGFWLPELVFGAPGFNGRFFRRRVFERMGDFDLRYFISADRQFLIRLALAHTKSRTLPTYGYYYRQHVASATLNPRYRNRDSISREHLRQALEFARLSSTTGEQRATFLCWHAFEGAKLILRSLRSGKLGEVVASVPALFRDDLLWPWRLFRALRLRNQVRALDRDTTDELGAMSRLQPLTPDIVASIAAQQRP